MISFKTHVCPDRLPCLPGQQGFAQVLPPPGYTFDLGEACARNAALTGAHWQVDQVCDEMLVLPCRRTSSRPHRFLRRFTLLMANHARETTDVLRVPQCTRWY